MGDDLAQFVKEGIHFTVESLLRREKETITHIKIGESNKPRIECSFDQALITNHPFSFWILNGTEIKVYDGIFSEPLLLCITVHESIHTKASQANDI